MHAAVRDLDDGVDRMPAADAWSGASHKAAAAMFTRATDKASTFKHYAEAVAQALSDGAGTIGTARTAPVNHADEVEESVENLGKAGKYGGPASGVATALYDTVTAKTFQDACVAAISGTAGIAGGYATGGALAAASAEAPALAPWAAAAGDAIGGWTFGYLGGIIGNVVCR